jgi:hypothetical protein
MRIERRGAEGRDAEDFERRVVGGVSPSRWGGGATPSPEKFIFFISKLHVSMDFCGKNYDFSS